MRKGIDEEKMDIKEAIEVKLMTPDASGIPQVKEIYFNDGRKAIYMDGNGNKKELELVLRSAVDETEAVLHKLLSKVRDISSNQMPME